jgi:hypothetical protein
VGFKTHSIGMMINIFDCETYEKEKNVYIYCISYSYKKKIYSIYKNDAEDIFINFLNQITDLIKNNKIIFYIHNINFDGILIMDSVFKNNLKFN